MAPSRILRTLAVAGAAALGLSACAIQIQSAPDPSIGDDTMLIAADNGSPFFEENFNPYLATSRIGADYIYEPLVLLDNLTGEEHPWLAERFEVPDPSTIVFTLREGVTWSDGEAFDAEDVAFTFDLIREFPSFDIKGAWQYIDSVETDGMQVTVNLVNPDVPARLIIEQTVIVPEHLWADVENADSFRNPDPVGTGPYTLGNFTAQQYAMDKNQDYWNADAVAAEHLVLPATNTELDVVTKGYDWAFQYMSDVEGTWLAANDANSYWFPPGGTIALIPNNQRAPFDDPLVRQALSWSLDRQAIADAAAEGYMDAAGQNGLLLPNQQDLLNPELPDGGAIAQDPERALELFAEAGYTQQGGKLVGEDGQPLEITITTANGYADWLRGVQELQRQFTAIGVTVKVEQPQPAGHTLALRNGDFDLIVSNVGGFGDLYQDFNNNLSSQFLVAEGEETGNNYSRYENPEVDELLAAYRVTTDEQEQLEIGYRLQQIYYDEVPTISLWYGGSWGLFSDQKFTGWTSEQNPFSPKTYESTPLLVLTSLERVETEGDD